MIILIFQTKCWSFLRININQNFKTDIFLVQNIFVIYRMNYISHKRETNSIVNEQQRRRESDRSSIIFDLIKV